MVTEVVVTEVVGKTETEAARFRCRVSAAQVSLRIKTGYNFIHEEYDR